MLPVSTSLDSLEALRDALLDERESLYVFKSVDCFPPVRTNDPLQNFNPVIRTVSRYFTSFAGMSERASPAKTSNSILLSIMKNS